MIVLLKHCKHNKMLPSSGETLLDLDFKVVIVIRTFCCVGFALLENNLVYHSFFPNGPLPGVFCHSFSFQKLV